MAIPVNAECPSASEKKLIFPETIIVDKIPKRGAINMIARKAFFIKSQESSSRPVAVQIEYQMFIL
jgi:hypothetical protein